MAIKEVLVITTAAILLMCVLVATEAAEVFPVSRDNLTPRFNLYFNMPKQGQQNERPDAKSRPEDKHSLPDIQQYFCVYTKPGELCRSQKITTKHKGQGCGRVRAAVAVEGKSAHVPRRGRLKIVLADADGARTRNCEARSVDIHSTTSDAFTLSDFLNGEAVTQLPTGRMRASGKHNVTILHIRCGEPSRSQATTYFCATEHILHETDSFVPSEVCCLEKMPAYFRIGQNNRCKLITVKASKKRSKRSLAGSAPELMYTFIEQAVQPGAHAALKCSAAGEPPLRFDWYLDGQLVTATQHRYTVSTSGEVAGYATSQLNVSAARVEDGGLYECRATNELGSAAHAARLNVYGPPYIRPTGTVKGISGGHVTILCPYYGFPISHLKWQKSNDEPITNPRYRQEGGKLKITELDQKIDSGSYVCSVSTPSGELARRDIQLIVNSPPVLSPLTFPPNLKSGDRTQLSCTVSSGDMPVYFSWFKDGIPISGSLEIEERSADFFSLLLFKRLSASHSGTYTCISTNTAGKVNTSVELIIKVPPSWASEPTDVDVLLGSSVVIHCDARGYPDPRIYWSRKTGQSIEDYSPLLQINNHLTMFANGSLSVSGATARDEGGYRCAADNGVGPPLLKTISLQVNEPARFEKSSQNMTAKRNEPVTIACDVLGDLPIHNVWTHNTKPLDVNVYRMRLSELKRENGLLSQLSVEQADRRDSGLYRCQASNAYGRSEHFIHLAVQERPDPPSNFQVMDVASRSVRLSWKRPYDGNSPVLGYMVQYRKVGGYPSSSSSESVDRGGGGMSMTTQHSWDGAEHYNVTIAMTENKKYSSITSDNMEQGSVIGLSPDTTYAMRMLAVNQIESSSFSDTIIAKTQEEAPTDPPYNVQVVPGEAGQLVVSWQPPARMSWNGPLQGYAVAWSPVEAAKTAEADGEEPRALVQQATVRGGGVGRYTITGLDQFTRYAVTVKAYNRASPGPASIPVTALTQEGMPTAPPQAVRCSPLSPQSLKVEWSPPPMHHHGGALLGYKIIYKPMLDVFSLEEWDIESSSGDAGPGVASEGAEVKRSTGVETHLHALRRATNYSVRALAFTSAGDGVSSAPVYCATEEDVPGPPARIKAISLTPTSIMVSWLPPSKPNGRIIFYTVFHREAGRGHQPTSQMVNVAELNPPPSVGFGGQLEVRQLSDNTDYEFWMSANTASGEGEASPPVTQPTSTRSAARVASFGVRVRAGAGRALRLSCVSVGSPAPRARWLRSSRAVTHSSLYRVTPDGHLLIYNLDPSVSGNYTCSAKNTFGSDEITYAVQCLMPPAAPALAVQYATTTAVYVTWNPTGDGGAPILGYTLMHARAEAPESDSASVELGADVTSYTVRQLQCGARYTLSIAAHNRVGRGPHSQPVLVSTKGAAPRVSSDRNVLWSNESTLALDVRRALGHSGGGGSGGSGDGDDAGAAESGGDVACPARLLSVQWRRADAPGQWHSADVAGVSADGEVVIGGLSAATWYAVRVTAASGAGRATAVLHAATTTTTGALISPPINFPMDIINQHSSENSSDNIIGMVSVMFAMIAFVSTISVAYILVKKRSILCNCGDSSVRQRAHSLGSTDKSICAEQQNLKNCQHDYSTSPTKGDKLTNEADVYEISPYATFQVGQQLHHQSHAGSRSVTASTLDHTLQFRTFGHLENDALPVPAPSPAPPSAARKKHSGLAHNAHPALPRPRKPSLHKDSDKIHSDCEMQQLSQYEKFRSRSRGCAAGPSYCIPLAQEMYHGSSSADSTEISPPRECIRTPRHFTERALQLHVKRPPSAHG